MATKPVPEKPASEPSPTAPAPRERGSVLGSLRHNRTGALTAALLVALLLGLLLSTLVPGKPGVLALVLLGALMSAAVGFTVRYLSEDRGIVAQVVALVATVLGVHVMVVTGAASGSIPALEMLGISAPSFNDALLAALATPAVSTGGLIAGLVAAIIAGWGPRVVARLDLD